ncbi:MAG: YidC/Oxa1 family membrane protein insertase [Clostridia bacterium]|nr:YidC/Oxa1 family membrane protein insertase [Clostridia bacterium]
MSFFSIIETLFIGPLKLIFEYIYGAAYKFIGNPGFAIIFLSLLMNILVLPLYKRADAMQEKARDEEARLSRGVAHIKKTFSGDERMMILQTYYRQNNHKPTSALNGSVSLLLEIPFFMAAYQFLSHLSILNGKSFGPITDLGAPDGLIVIGSLTINLLPVLMTAINVVSSAIYLKGFPLKTKIQLYGMAAFFLVFLYTSPSGLVFYWTLNNVFSLVKNIFYKIKNPSLVLKIMTSVLGAAAIIYSLFFFNTEYEYKKTVLCVIGAILILPGAISLIKSKIRIVRKEKAEVKPNRKTFILGGVFLTVLVGVLIPSAFISASPQEYVDLVYYHNPLWYIVSTAAMSAGFFLVWMGVFYWLANERYKVVFERLMVILSIVTLVNYMFFGTDLGNISRVLQYDNGVSAETKMILINLAVIAAVCIVLFLISAKLRGETFGKVCSLVMLTGIIALGGMSGLNVTKINSSLDKLSFSSQNEFANFNLSKSGENVVVIMLDRAVGEYVPYIFNEKPELAEKFDGFTYYSNVLSFGGKTNFALPPLLGGYEYTPVEMNKRENESLGDKHDEALKVMPVLFSENGYDVTVIDPTYAGYEWISDLSIYDSYENINAYHANGIFGSPETVEEGFDKLMEQQKLQKQAEISNNHRNFFCLSLMKVMPLVIQPVIYDDGVYNQLNVASASSDEVSIDDNTFKYSVQSMTSLHEASGVPSTFMNGYNVILNLENMTNIVDDESDNFLFMTNDMTHEPILLQTPDYVPSQNVDNTEYDSENEGRFVVDGKELSMTTSSQMIHYHANMSALLRLADWFDYLREQGVYDNTKIILVSDHGHNLAHNKDMYIGNSTEGLKNTEMYFPLLMVKEIGATGFETSDEFMTNADVPTLATDGLIKDPKNPFTGKSINSNEKTAHDQFVILSWNWDILSNNGNQFEEALWVSVKDNIHDLDNWTELKGKFVLTEHKVNK